MDEDPCFSFTGTVSAHGASGVTCGVERDGDPPPFHDRFLWVSADEIEEVLSDGE